MQLDDKLLQKLEGLSALKIPESERQATISALADVLEFANILNDLDTASIAKNTSEFTPLREDIPHASGISEDVLSNAPARDGLYFSVPKIIE